MIIKINRPYPIFSGHITFQLQKSKICFRCHMYYKKHMYSYSGTIRYIHMQCRICQGAISCCWLNCSFIVLQGRKHHCFVARSELKLKKKVYLCDMEQRVRSFYLCFQLFPCGTWRTYFISHYNHW